MNSVKIVEKEINPCNDDDYLLCITSALNIFAIGTLDDCKNSKN